MNIKTTLKASVAAAALVAVAAPGVSGSANASGINDAGDNNSVVISGQLARSILMMDNGDSSEIQHVDGGNDTSSRIRVLVSGQLTESVAVGGVWEASLPNSNDAGSASIGRNTETKADNGFGFRKTDITFTHSSYGKLSIGQAETSTDIKPSLDSTGSNNAGLTYGGAVSLNTSTTNANLGTTAGSHFGAYFGGRDDRIKYDTPDIMGFKLSGSMIQGNAWDVGLTYGATYGDFQVAAAAGYKELESNTNSANIGTGLAVKHSSGISAGGHWSRELTNGAATTLQGHEWGVELGYTTTAMSNLGATSFNVVYATAYEASQVQFEANVMGFHVKQSLPAGVAVFASYEISEYDDETTSTSIDDVSTALVGTMISF